MSQYDYDAAKRQAKLGKPSAPQQAGESAKAYQDRVAGHAAGRK